MDAKGLRMVDAIERSLTRLHLDSQGEFIAIINAIAMQLESSQPELAVIRLLAAALRALAVVRQIGGPEILRLDDALNRLIQHLEALSSAGRER